MISPYLPLWIPQCRICCLPGWESRHTSTVHSVTSQGQCIHQTLTDGSLVSIQCDQSGAVYTPNTDGWKLGEYTVWPVRGSVYTKHWRMEAWWVYSVTSQGQCIHQTLTDGSLINTVKPVHNGHSVEKQKVADVGRWPLYRGPKFSRSIYFLSFIRIVFRLDGIFKRIAITAEANSFGLLILNYL